MPSRRTFLAAGAAAIATGAAGCGERPPPPTDRFDRPDDRWPTAGYDPAGTGNPPAGPDGATPQWRTRRLATSPPLYGFLATPVVADGRVYVPTEEGREDGFGTFDAATGDRLATWGSDRDYPPDFGPAIADGALYATGRGALCRFG